MKNKFLSKSVPRGTRTIWRYLGALFLLFTFAIGNVWGTSYIPGDCKVVTANETIDYATIAGANATTSGKWIVNPRGGTTTGKKYTNLTSDTNGNPDGIVDNIATITSNVNMATIQVPSTAKYNQSGKYVIHMRITGITGIIAHGVTGSSGRGCAIYGQEYSTSLTENTEYGSALASMTRSGNSGSFLLQYTGFTASKEYLITIAATGGDDQLYAIELIAGSVTKHTVTYDLNGGGGTTPTQADVAEGAKFTLHNGTTGITAPTNKDFDGWHDGTTKYAGGAEYTMGTSDVELTAQWKDHVAKYTLVYRVDGVAVGNEPVNVSGTPVGIADPTKDCYTFAGWSPALDVVSGTDGATVYVDATWTPVYSSSATLISDDVVSNKPNVNTVFAASNIVSSITFTSGNYEFTSNETKPGYYGYKDKASGDYMKILVKQGKRAQVLFGNLGADPTITVNGVAKSLDAARTTGDMAENTFTWTASAEDALISITMGSGTNTLKKVDVIQLYTATRVDSKSDGAGSDANVLETTLPTPTAISGWTFTGWTANEDVKAGEETKTAGTVLAAGTYTLLANTTFTAQWTEASSTYDITYVSAHGTAPAADNAASVVLAELDAEGWAHKGWTANVDVTVDAATVTAGTLIANGKTVILASNVTFTAVWKEIFTVTFDSKDGSAVAPVDVEDGATLAAAPSNPTKDDYIFLGWSETDGGDVVADITAITISDDKTFYAKWKLDVQVSEIVFSNSFKGWIVGSTVTVFYMAGESAPTIASYAGKNLKAEGGVVISGDKIIATATDDSELEFDLTMTEVTPLATTGAQTFDGTEGYIKTRHAWTSDRKWKMSKYATDGRVARGETSMYIFLGAAESVTLGWGAQKVTDDVAVYVNGTFVKNIGKNNNSAIELSNGNNMVALYSLQTSGDIWLNGLTVAPWVPVTAVTLKEGENEISAKEIWASTSFTLTAEVTPDNASNKTITWTSSNDAVATVVNGVVTGVAANATPVTITASTVDGVTATCAVTVTAAPEPSADPVITTQPQSANYYEGASIAALEVVATGESLTYQWYLGSDAIDGATAATYQPTVSAIGTYVYHCVVTNTEAGNLPTSLASDNATITIADDPAAIKLLDGEGNVNTTNFTTGVTAGTVNFDDADHNCASFGSTGGSIVGLTGINKVVAYNATTTQTKVKFVLYNTNSSAKELYLQKVLEDATVAVTETISVPSKELYETQYYTYNSSDLRSFYVTVNSTNIKVLQVKVIDNGTALKRAGEAGYELNLNQGRVFGAQNVATNFEGLAFAPSSNAKVLNSTELPITTPLSFTIATPLTLTVETSAAKYYVSQNASEDGTTATAVTSAGEEEFDLTVVGTWYIVPSTTSAVKLTNIAFELPKAAKPVVADLDNVDYCTGETIDALTVSATVSDGGAMLYQWYKDGVAIEGADEATYQPTADAEYYVVVVNTLTGHQNSDPTQSNTITVTGHAGTVITGTTGAEDWPGADVTISVAASGKNLHYAWYTCDNAMGTNPVAVDPAVNAAELDVIVAAADSYYKVIVSGDCGSAQEAVITVVARQTVEQVNVTEATVWNFATSIAGSTSLENQTDVVLANVDGINNNASFNSQALKGTFNKMPGNYFQGSKLSFTTEVAGMLRVIFRGTNNNSRHLQICVGEGEEVIADWDYKGSGEGAEKDSAIYVPAGKVTLKALEGTAAQNARIYRMELVTEDSYHRTVNPSNIGTLCWTNDAVLGGATLYELAGKDANSKLVFDEVPENRLEAGKPYIFVPENGNTVIKVYNTTDDEPLTAPLDAIKQMQGTFDDMTTVGTTEGDGDLWYKYIISNNHYIYVDYQNCNLGAYRAYFHSIDAIPAASEEPQQGSNGAPRRRLVVGGNNVPAVTTGVDNLNVGDQPIKVIIDGQMYILRGDKMYDATGRLVK